MTPLSTDDGLADSKQARAKTAIVLLNWNSGPTTANCIRSLLKMDRGDFEIIVVDNGSKDGSADYLENEFPNTTILRQGCNLGFAAGCNVGIRRALERNFQYILLLNNDTLVDREFLTEMLRLAERHQSFGVVSPKIFFWDFPDRLWWAGGDFSPLRGIPMHRGRKEVDIGQFDNATASDWATGCAFLIPCHVCREVGLLDETLFAYAEDLDFSIRVRKAGYPVWFAPKAKLWHKEGICSRDNAGEHFRLFLSTRNLLVVMRKHATVLQWLTFLPNFVVRYAGFLIALNVVRGDLRSAWAVVRGIGAFLMSETKNPGAAREQSHPDDRVGAKVSAEREL